jgi:aerobic-type carbon monoxide dehydrogenase small subunit (CoxS/CutS family)
LDDAIVVKNPLFLCQRERIVVINIQPPGMTSSITFIVNGQSRTVATDPDRTLLEVLREELQLTGAKFGCGEGDCRACTVLVDGKGVAACQMRMEEVSGKNVVTIEGLAQKGDLHPVQKAFLDEGAFQCGYCTPGMILGIVGAMKQKPNASETEILLHMNKHICRCCSYSRIQSAIRRVIKK